MPLIYKDKAIGVFDLQSPFLNYFTQAHEETLSALASHVAVAIENARLYERVVAAEARLDRELKFAREIQSSLIQDRFPEIPGTSFWAEFRPARTLGGDLYDFFPYDDDKVAIAIGDVSGKGAPAALYAALASGILRTRAGRKYPPAEMLRLVNVSLRQRTIEGRFMSLCYAVYDARTRVLRFANSGAPPPIVCKKGKTEVLSIAGFPLGMFDKAEYQELELQLEPGDLVVFYTDGLVRSPGLARRRIWNGATSGGNREELQPIGEEANGENFQSNRKIYFGYPQIRRSNCCGFESNCGLTQLPTYSFVVTLHGTLEILDAFADALSNFRQALRAEEERRQSPEVSIAQEVQSFHRTYNLQIRRCCAPSCLNACKAH